MSLILDALQKAEDDRRRRDDMAELGTVPEDEIMLTPNPGEEPDGIPRWQLGLGVAILSFLAAAVVYLYFPSTKSTQVDNVVQAQVDQGLSPSKPTGVSANEKSEPVDSGKNFQKEISAQYERARLDTTQTPQSKDNTQVEQDPVAKLYNKPKPVETSVPDTTAVDQANSESSTLLGEKWKNVEFALLPETSADEKPGEIPAKETSLENDASSNISSDKSTLDGHPQIPSIHELKESLKDQIASMFYTQHQFEGEDGSYVIVNKRLVREGNQLVADVTLQEILRDGFIGKYQDTRFKVKALSSWVNM